MRLREMIELMEGRTPAREGSKSIRADGSVWVKQGKEWKREKSDNPTSASTSSPQPSAFDKDELTLLATYLKGKTSDKKKRAATGMDQDTMLRIANRLREKLAKPGQASWQVDLAQHAKTAFGKA
jgi:hypothetical protein